MAHSMAVRPSGGPRTWTVIDEGYRTVVPVEEWLEAHRHLWSPNTIRGYSASSTGRCNTGLLEREYLLGEDLGGGLPAEDLAGPVVQYECDGLEVGGGPPRQVGALGEVLAQQPVGRSYVCQAAAGAVFVRAADSMTR